eukprot:Protomagalhaensia_sp_Gyna_25__734@NODE_134_length_4981_cov_115_469446_g106_i0_p4_GENE_NODE_134_length_4981_cov_115_469446_g106_i0NODE_134_length_4981_cov_115_469446_g106_i0_p4_ORF_typecomplete_len164_score19_38CGI121/PF08617_10/6_8e05_NODE_134_length_4981_cov_115_469446_g106_i044254916
MPADSSHIRSIHDRSKKMKVKALDPEFSALQLRYCECTLQASSPSTGLDQWENFKRDVSLYHDIDLTNPKLAEVVEQIQLKPVPFLFSLDKIVSWRVVQAAVLSALSSVTSGSKRIKSFKSDVLYRLAPGWSVGSIIQGATHIKLRWEAFGRNWKQDLVFRPC